VILQGLVEQTYNCRPAYGTRPQLTALKYGRMETATGGFSLKLLRTFELAYSAGHVNFWHSWVSSKGEGKEKEKHMNFQDRE
jgi:hypothetical protein